MKSRPVAGLSLICAAEASSSAAFRCAGAFARGLLTPTGRVAGAAAVLAGLVVWWLCALGSAPERIAAGRPQNWMRNTRDDYRRMTVLAIQGAAAHREPGRELALFVGPSALRELLPEADEMRTTLADKTGREWSTLVLAGDALPVAGAAAVVDRFGADFDGWIVLAVNRHTFSRDEATEAPVLSRLGFDSEHLDRALTGEIRWMPLALRRASFFFGGLGGFWNLGGDEPPPWIPYRYGHYKAWSPEPGRTPPDLVVDFPGVERRLAVLTGLAAGLKASGGRSRLALAECPFVDEFAPEFQNPIWRAERREYARRMREWAAAHDAVWWDVAPGLDLTKDDYGDVRHVRRASARTAYFHVLAERLAAEDGAR